MPFHHILLVSDLHERSACLKAFAKLLERKHFDGIICPGDLTERRSGNAKYALDFLALCKLHKTPFRMVHGNNDDVFIRKLLVQKKVLLHFACEKLWGERICGVGWLDEDAVGDVPAHFDVQGSILVTHAQPNWRATFAPKTAPKLHISGHMHAWEGVAWHNGVQWVKVPTLMRGRYGILTLPEIKVKFLSI